MSAVNRCIPRIFLTVPTPGLVRHGYVPAAREHTVAEPNARELVGVGCRLTLLTRDTAGPAEQTAGVS